MESRIYAENPSKDFMPGSGTVSYLRTPSTSSSVRIDTGLFFSFSFFLFFFVCDFVCGSGTVSYLRTLSTSSSVRIDTGLFFFSCFFSCFFIFFNCFEIAFFWFFFFVILCLVLVLFLILELLLILFEWILFYCFCYFFFFFFFFIYLCLFTVIHSYSFLFILIRSLPLPLLFLSLSLLSSPPLFSKTKNKKKGIREGDTVSVFYDPMIAKLIVWDQNRHRAMQKVFFFFSFSFFFFFLFFSLILLFSSFSLFLFLIIEFKKMRKALDDFRVSGLSTNISFLKYFFFLFLSIQPF